MRTYELFINGEFIPNGDREMLQVHLLLYAPAMSGSWLSS